MLEKTTRSDDELGNLVDHEDGNLIDDAVDGNLTDDVAILLVIWSLRFAYRAGLVTWLVFGPVYLLTVWLEIRLYCGW